MERYKKYAMIMCSVGLMLLFVGVTYSFFNYTRTGAINNLGTGRIYFSSTQSDTLNITNVFPMTSTEASNANLDAVTISITGDTTYADGEEFEISIVDVNNTVNGKEVPINYIATYTVATGGTIGTSSNSYYTSRNSKDATIYTLESSSTVYEGKQVLVGYIDNGATGINGTLTIKAYVDADRIAISDTYPQSYLGYYVNTNMTQEELNTCVTYFTSLGFDQYLEEGESLEAYCRGDGLTFQYDLNDGIYNQEQLTYLSEHNIINYRDYSNETSSEWVNGREVFTTAEWNSLGSTPISFKIRAESNEGIWVSHKINSCPECVFTYTNTELYTTWNTESETPSVLTSSDYSENYDDVIASSGKDFFLGLKLNDSNQIEKAYACGLYNGTTPFCIEGYSDGTKYYANKRVLQATNLWNNTCQLYNEETSDEEIRCGVSSPGVVVAYSDFEGGSDVSVVLSTGEISDIEGCFVYIQGTVHCGHAMY